jgi:hypothetical protein
MRAGVDWGTLLQHDKYGGLYAATGTRAAVDKYAWGTYATTDQYESLNANHTSSTVWMFRPQLMHLVFASFLAP